MSDAAMNQPVLRVNNLWKVFAPKGVRVDTNDPASMAQAEEKGAVTAVRDVSMTLERGEFFVVMGLSGSGKSTFIRCLLRLIEPTSGEVWMGGHEVSSLGRRQLTEFRREWAAMVFQHYGLLPHKTVLQNAAFGLKLKGVSRQERLQRAEEALVQVGLGDWLGHLPHQLSGGMQQRVGIARALTKDPELLLMDEPFSGLDPLIRREMQDEMARLQDELQRSVLFVTHDLDEAIRLGDRMAVMRGGEFVQVGTPEEVLANPADEYVERFVDGARTEVPASAGRGGQAPAAARPAAPAEAMTAATEAASTKAGATRAGATTAPATTEKAAEEKAPPLAKPRRAVKKVGATRAV